MKIKYLIVVLVIFLLGCSSQEDKDLSSLLEKEETNPFSYLTLEEQADLGLEEIIITKEKKRLEIKKLSQETSDGEVLKEEEEVEPQELFFTQPDFLLIKPPGWQEEKIDETTTLYYPTGTDLDDPQAETISIIIIELKEDWPLEEMISQAMEKEKEIITDLTVTEQTETRVSFLEGKKIKFTGTVNNNPKQFTQVLAKKSNKLYTLIHLCSINNCHYENIFNLVSKSLIPR